MCLALVRRELVLVTLWGDLPVLSLYQLKPRFQALLRPLVARLAAAGVTANGVTCAAMLVSLGLGVCAAELQSVFFSRTIGEPRGAARD